MSSDRKLLIKIGLFIFASSLVGGYLKERVRLAHTPADLQLDPQARWLSLASHIFSGAMEYFREPLGLIAIALFVLMFIRARKD